MRYVRAPRSGYSKLPESHEDENGSLKGPAAIGLIVSQARAANWGVLSVLTSLDK